MTHWLPAYIQALEQEWQPAQLTPEQSRQREIDIREAIEDFTLLHRGRHDVNRVTGVTAD